MATAGAPYYDECRPDLGRWPPVTSMRWRTVQVLRGYEPLCIEGSRLLLARKLGLHVLDRADARPRRIASLPAPGGLRVAAQARITRRLFRPGPRCALPLAEGSYIVAHRHGIYRVDPRDGSVRQELDLSGRYRPLTFARLDGLGGFSGTLYFGEYVSGGTDEVRIYRRDREGQWSPVCTFPPGEIDHVHGLVADPIRGCVWILTGDYGRGAGIWRARDEFRRVEPVVRGEQQFRTCALFPLEEGLLYATDSHLEANSIRMLSESGGRWVSRELHPTAGSCIHACQVGDRHVFGTSYEPGPSAGRGRLRTLLAVRGGPGIQGVHCELVVGRPDEGFERIARWIVDPLPKVLFQFSSILLPRSVGPGAYIAAYGRGLALRDDRTYLMAAD